MNAKRLNTTVLLATLLFLPLASRAADTDIYSGLLGSAAVPNVLIAIDNSANFGTPTSGAPGTCTLTNTATGVTAINSLANTSGGTPSGTTGGILQCALYQVLQGLPVNPDGSARVNVGVMVYNANNIHDFVPATGAFGTNCNSGTGGCLIVPLTPMAGAARTNLLNWITTWQTDLAHNIKENNAENATIMQEAWAYYAGKTGLSGRSYAGVQPPSGCQKNFVIFIGNSWGSSNSPGDPATPAADTALTAAYGANPIPTPNPILGSMNTACGVGTLAAANNHLQQGDYADEWSRFMRSTDIFSATSGSQNITTYTIGVLGPTCQASYAALLMSMAQYGGGKFFPTADNDSVVQAILRILNEVQATNSVFAAATLPVSVNAQGTYLNQIYMGMFRPDAQGNPRWVGNLKQYQFQFDANKNLFLADAVGKAAISSGGTGFLDPGVASFWTCTNPTQAGTLPSPYSSLPTCATDPANGFWLNFADYVSTTTGHAFDLVDGEVVEKGGVAQQLRLTNLIDNYASSPSGPRNLYTWCPNDPNNTAGTCIADLTDSSNVFATTNANVTSASLGSGLNLAVTSITRNGTTATVTTAGVHGLASGATVTISGAIPNDYNATNVPIQLVAGQPNQFTYSPVPDYPVSPAQGQYTASSPSLVQYPLSSLNRAVAGTASTAVVTAVTASTNPFTQGQQVAIVGATPANYDLQPNISLVNSQTFQYPVTVNPTPSPVGSYAVSLANAAVVGISSASCNGSTKIVTVNTGSAHGLRTGDQATISGDTQTPSTKQMNGSYTNVTVTSGTQFTYQASACPGTPVNAKVQGGPASPLAVTLTRNETAVGTATVTATLTSASQFANGDSVNVALASGTQPANETGYLITSTAISCSTNPCGTTFTYTIATAPAAPNSGATMYAAAPGPGQPITMLTHVGTTATATVNGPGFMNGGIVNISGTTILAHESPYMGPYTGITCVPAGAGPCTTFSYGPIVNDPVSPATGNISASNPFIAPNRTNLINWVRGEDNYGDEQSLCPPGTTTGTGNCPSPRVTVRPSVHGDTLHSRPITINYGGSIGVVAFYGANDGIYRAVNGNQSTAIGSVPAGGELWGFVAPDFYGKLNRQRTNSPALLLPSTPPGIIPAPTAKDYFFDGPTGVYQGPDASGNLIRIIYVATRRGGHFLYAINVTKPLQPSVLWRINDNTPGFDELGQNWSLSQAAHVAGYSNPVLFLGAGYDDGAEDSEPPTYDTQGRGIFAVDAISGALVWSAGPRFRNLYTDHYWFRDATNNPSTCTGTATQANCLVDAMTYSIAADLTLVDRDANGTVDRLYAVDVGGNVWRVDLEPAAGNTPNFWQVTQLAQLASGSFVLPLDYFAAWGLSPTAPGNPWLTTPPSSTTYPGTPRKFFFPAEIIKSVAGTNYDAIFVGSGDREHPLYGNQSYNVINRMYMIKDFNTGNDSVSQGYPIIENNLDDCTGTAADPNTCSTITTGATTPLSYCQLTPTQQHSGYYVTLLPGEKVVNAPLAVVGTVFFGTNQPETLNPNACNTNLGVARGYALDPYCAATHSVIYDGGGMPPSPVAGIVQIGNDQALFCIGCGGQPGPNPCTSAECGQRLRPVIPAVRNKTFWYIEGK